MNVRKAVRALVNPWRAYREKIDAIHELLDKFNKTQYRLDRVSEERDEMKRQLDILAAVQFYEPGHFYSPIPSKLDVREHLAKLETQSAHELPAIELNDRGQLDLLDALKPYYGRIPFQAQPLEGLLYHFDNPNYPYTDGMMLFCMLNHVRPRRLIEIGSYRGMRHRRNLPLRGQRTHTNARTRRGPRRSIAGKKKTTGKKG